MEKIKNECIETTNRLKKASDFEPRQVEYLWEPYLPKGEFTVLMAAGGTGKSILTCGIAEGNSYNGIEIIRRQEPPALDS